MDVKGKLEQLDRAQQQRRALAIPIATVKKFGEDKSSNMAAMMAFWAFFSIFPLLLAMVTVLGYVLPESEKQRVLEQVAGYIPLLDPSTIGGLQGSVLALVVGLGAALWSGMAVVKVTQFAFNSVWEVPEVERPKMVEQIKRSLLALVTIGLGLVASTLAIGFVSGDNPTLDLGPLSRVLGFAVVIVLDVALFILAFRLLTDREVTTRDVLPGAVFAGVMFWILSLSSIIITQHLSGAQATYGTFATVITILWWFYLQSQLTLLGAQVNVVLKRGYYPRGLVDAPATEADHRLLEDYAKERKFDENQKIDSDVLDEPVREDPYDDMPEDKAPDAHDDDDDDDDGHGDADGGNADGAGGSRPASHRAASRR